MLTALRRYTHLTPDEWRCVLAAQSSGEDPRRCGEGRWTSWSLLDFRYRAHDTLGYLFAVSSFLPIVIIIFLSGLASAPSPRRVPALVLLLCLVVDTALNTALKAVVRSPRPPHPGAGKENYSTVHGMPSDHAQFIVFFITYLCLRARQLHGRSATASSAGRRQCPPPLAALSAWGSRRQRLPEAKDETVAASGARCSSPLTPSVLACFIAIAGVVIGGRIYNGYHTVEQVVAGALLGAVLAVVCTRAPAQAALTTIATRAVLPIMLLCTAWTRWVA